MNVNNMLRAIGFVWKRAKVWTICSIVFSVATGLIPLASLWIMKELVNTVASILQDETTTYSHAFFLLALQFVVMLTASIIEGLKNFMDDKVRIVLEHDLKKLSSEKAMSVPYTYYDIPEFYDHLNRIKGSPGSKFIIPLRKILNTLEGIIKVISYLVFLFTIHWLLVLMSVLGAIPIFIVQSIYGRKNYWLMFMQTPAAREVNYLEYLMNDKHSAKETRIFNMSNYLMERWSSKFKKNSKEKLDLIKKQQFAEIGLDSLTALMYVGAAGVIIWLIRTTTLKIGEFVAIGQAVQGTQQSISQISENLARIHEDSLYINDYFRFVDFEYRNTTRNNDRRLLPLKINESIEFDHVYYKYPDAENYTLENISLKIRKGEKIAIVGLNGSGKTTLVNLLLDLYKPTNGTIKIDNINLNDICPDEWKSNVTAIFQDFIKYSFQVDENIAIGKNSNEINQDKVLEVSKISGVDNFVKKFKNGYSTQLGRFLTKGEEISGGQWQKTAISRALYRNSQVVVLDEPTSSLDPIAELEVFSHFDRVFKDKTVLYISHRMSAAKFADKIIVLDNGKIHESGNHQELINLQGKYYEMYNKQKSWYEDQNHVREAANWK